MLKGRDAAVLRPYDSVGVRGPEVGECLLHRLPEVGFLTSLFKQPDR
jgi:hypothetical protein